MICLGDFLGRLLPSLSLLMQCERIRVSLYPGHLAGPFASFMRLHVDCPSSCNQPSLPPLSFLMHVSLYPGHLALLSCANILNAFLSTINHRYHLFLFSCTFLCTRAILRSLCSSHAIAFWLPSSIMNHRYHPFLFSCIASTFTYAVPTPSRIFSTALIHFSFVFCWKVKFMRTYAVLWQADSIKYPSNSPRCP